MKKWIYFLMSVILVTGLAYGGAFAADYPGANNEGGSNFGTHNGWQNPNHSIGGCNKKGDLCWGITIEPPYPPKRHLPIEVYGGSARNLIANGQITHANMDRYGVFYLNVWSRYYNSSFDCDVNVSRRRYHCVENW